MAHAGLHTGHASELQAGACAASEPSFQLHVAAKAKKGKDIFPTVQSEMDVQWLSCPQTHLFALPSTKWNMLYEKALPVKR